MAELPERITIGQKYGPAMEITDQEEADRYFGLLVEHTMKHAQDEEYKSREGAENLERQNLGYCAGYYDTETRERVERLFSCAHPVFGSVEQFGVPTPEAAFQSGLERAEKARRESEEGSG